MDTSHRRRRRRRRIKLLLAAMTTSALLLLALVSSSTFNPSLFSSGASKMKEEIEDRVVARRRLGGLGSSPPTCRWKCGRCAPCKPVHVPIQPGFAMKLEYYPEAWRCKCRNRLFMP